MDDKILQRLNCLTKTEKTAFLSAVIFGIITHIHIFSVNYVFHDSVDIDTLGVSYTSGRWALGFMEELAERFVGVYQLPFINGFISIFFIALAAMMVVNALKVKNALSSAYIAMVMVALPVVAAHFAFMFTATAYFFSMLLCMFAVFIFDRKPSFITFILSCTLICFALGIYQAYFSLAVSFALVILLVRGIKTEAETLELIKKGVALLAMLVVSLVMYLAVNKFVLSVKGLELSLYQGLNNMGRVDMNLLPKAIREAYHQQFDCTWIGVITSEFERSLARGANLLCVVSFVIVLCKIKASFLKKIMLIILFCLLPLAFNLVYPMAPGSMNGVHALMRFSLVFTFVLPVVFLELIPQPASPKAWKRAVSLVVAAALWLIPVVFCYRNNTAYLNAELAEEEAEAYYASLVTRIRSTEGYRDELPVAYVGFIISDQTFTVPPMYGSIYTYILGFPMEVLINADRWEDFCALHLGWPPTVVEDVSEFAQMEEVMEMPCYPDDGSIRVINDAVVVKFYQP